MLVQQYNWIVGDIAKRVQIHTACCQIVEIVNPFADTATFGLVLDLEPLTTVPDISFTLTRIVRKPGALAVESLLESCSEYGRSNAGRCWTLHSHDGEPGSESFDSSLCGFGSDVTGLNDRRLRVTTATPRECRELTHMFGVLSEMSTHKTCTL